MRYAFISVISLCISVSDICYVDAGIILYSERQVLALTKSMRATKPPSLAIQTQARGYAGAIAARDNISIAAAHYRAAETIAKADDAAAHARKIVFHLERALEGRFNVAECHVDLGQIYLAAGDFPKAIEHLLEVAEQRPDLRLKLARALLAEGNKADAIANAEAAEAKLKEAMLNDPKDWASEVNWIASLEFLERFDEAIAHLNLSLIHI